MAVRPSALRYVRTDVTDEASIAALVASATGANGPVDVLFNNAAIFEMAPLLESGADSSTASSASTSGACSS